MGTKMTLLIVNDCRDIIALFRVNMEYDHQFKKLRGKLFFKSGVPSATKKVETEKSLQ